MHSNITEGDNHLTIMGVADPTWPGNLISGVGTTTVDAGAATAT